MKLDKRVTIAILGTAAAGAGLGLAYYISKQRAEVEVPVQIEQSHVSWLEAVAKKHTEGDTGKALQKLIEHCQISSKDPTVQNQIFTEVRCNTCGKKEKVDYTAIMTGAQLGFVQRMTKKHDIGGGEGKALRVMFEYALDEVEESAIFG